MKAYKHFGGDMLDVRYFFEEGRALARVILRDLQSIEEIYMCIHDSRERQRLHEENPEVEVRNSVAQAGMRFQNDYYRIVAPTLVDGMRASPDIPYDKIDLKELREWMADPRKRGKLYQESAALIRDELRTLDLVPPDWSSYVAPVGEAAYEIMKLFVEE